MQIQSAIINSDMNRGVTRSFLHIVVLMQALGSHSQGAWTTLESFAEIEHFAVRYDDIYALNDSSGWTGNADGRIFKFTDFGETITLQYEGLSPIRSLEFLNDSIGFAGTLFGQVFLRTTDGGQNWEDIGDRFGLEKVHVCGLAKADDSTMYGVGKWAGPAQVFKSTDSGENWEVMDLSGISGGLTDAYFFDANYGFVTGDSNIDSLGGAIFRTMDGGQNWEVVHYTNVFEDFIWKIQFVTDSLVFASVQGFPSNSLRILKSSDQGASWETIVVDDSDSLDFTLQGVGFVNDTLGWAGGWGNGLYQTVDGGRNWQLLDVGSNYNRFEVRNPNLAYASGNRFYRYMDTLTLSSPEAPLGILEESLESHQSRTLQVYPIPFKDELKIDVDLDSNTIIKLTLHHVDGRLVQEIAKGEFKKGKHVLSADTTSLNPGVYILRFKTSYGYYYQRVVKD